MELELRPRRSPFDDGLSKASLATPSCCCCCCCLNAIGAASGIVAADLSHRARNSGKSTWTRVGLGVLGFILIPAVLGLTVLAADTLPGGGSLAALVAFFVVLFGVLYSALRFASDIDPPSWGRGILVSIAISVLLGVASVFDVILLFGLANIGAAFTVAWFVLIPISIGLGWLIGSASHA